MKKISENNIKIIKEQHFNYCKDLVQVSNLSMEDKELLFIKNPFSKTFKVKKVYKQKFNNIDLREEYKNFRSNSNNWNGVKLLKLIGLDVCPYCGMNYISTITKKNNRIISEATFDHYLSQSYYKMLTLNIYNLIPCCKNCNTTFKGRSLSKIVNPYFDSLEDNIKFQISKENLLSNIYSNNLKIEIEIENLSQNNTKRKIIDNHIETIVLKERYNYFQKIAKSIIKKKLYYNHSYIDELECFDGLNLKKCDIEKMLICQDIYSENEPFLKFKTDIWEQLS